MVYWNRPKTNCESERCSSAKQKHRPRRGHAEAGHEHTHEVAGKHEDERVDAERLIERDIGEDASKEAETAPSNDPTVMPMTTVKMRNSRRSLP
jgi:hypothetical protein